MSQQQMSAEEAQQRRLHEANLTGGATEDREGEAAEILRYLSNVDDLPIGSDDPVMGQLVSKLVSTANLTEEQVKSNEWVFEYILVLYLCKFPRPDGMHSGDRAWSHDDVDAFREPMQPERRMEIEAHVSMSTLALTRSEGMAAVKEGTRTVKESIVSDEKASNSSSGGILGRLRS